MADNSVKFFIELAGGQQIEVATGNLKKMGQETKKNTKAQKDAAAASGDFNYSLNQGVTGASASAKSFSKMSQASNGLVGSYAALAASSFAISAGFNRLREAALAEQLLKGLETQGARTGLTLTVVAENMRTLTGDAISMAEGMQAASQMTAAGFSTQTMERLTKVATDAAAALGRNVPDAMDRIIKGTTKLEPELLDELGIMTKLDEATRLYATEIGKAPSQLSRFEKQQAFVNAVAAEGERKFAGLSDSVSNLKSYDSLSAAFTDLGNAVLGFFNGALLPVANLLANNSVVLTSTLVLFASTIIGQLLPALAEMAEKSAKAADAAKELATAKKDAIQKTIDDAKATALKNATEARGFAIHQKGAKAFKDRAAAIKAGSTSTEDFEGAINSLNRSITKYDNNIANGVYATEERIAAVKELKSELSAQIAVLKEVQALDAKAASASPDEAKVAIARTKANAAELASVIAQTTSESVEAASGGDFTGAFEKLNEGVAKYKDKLNEVGEAGGFKKLFGNVKQAGTAIKSSLGGIVASTRAANGGLATLRVAFVSAAGGARILGLAITSMLPIIGQVLMVAGLLWEGVKWLYEKTKPEGSAALEKALEDQEERYKNVGEMAENLKRIGMDSAKSQVDSLTAVSNKVNEIADGYDAIKTAEGKLGKSPLEAVSAGPNTLENLKLGADVVDNEAYKALEALTKSGYGPLSDSIVQTIANTKKLNDVNVTAAEKQKILEAILNNTKKTFQDVGSNSKAFSDSLTALDKSVEEFGRSSVTATPFDAIVRDLTETTATMYELESSMYKGAISAKDFGVQITSISSRASGLLDIDVQGKLREFNSAAAEIAKLEKQRESGQLNTEGAAKLATLTNKQAEETAKIGRLVADNVAKRQQELSALQNMARVNASLAAMEAARFQKASRGIEDSKELARAQDKSAERQAALAVQTLDAQIKLQKGLKSSKEEELRINLKAQADKRKEIEDTKKGYESQKKQVVSITEYQLKFADELRKINALLIQADLFRLSIGEKFVNNAEAFRKKMQELPANFSRTLTSIGTAFKDGPLGQLLFDKTVKTIPLKISETDGTANLQADLANLEAGGLRLKAELAGINASIQQLDATKYGELAKLLTEVEKKSRDARYDLAFLLEGLGVINKLTQAAAAIDLEREKLNKSVLGTFGQQVNIRQKQLGIEIKAIEAENQAQKQTLETRIESAKQEQKKAGLESERGKLLEAQIKNDNTRLEILKVSQGVLVDQAKERSYILSLEEASFNVFTEGLEMQQRSLDVLRKRAELQSTILDQQQESRQLDAEIGAARTGQPIGERAQKSLELQAAEETFALAKEQLDLKLVGIKLEYELLEAQRIASVVDFKAKSALLAAEAANLKAQGKDSSQVTQMVDQLNSSINYLSIQSYKGLMNMAMEAEKRGVEILGKRAEKIRAELDGIGVIRTGADTIKQAINNFTTTQKAIEGIYNAREPITDKPLDSPVVFSAEEAARKQVETNTALINSIESKFPDLATGINRLAEIIKEQVGSLDTKVSEAVKAVLPASAKAATTATSVANDNEDMPTVQASRISPGPIGGIAPQVNIPEIPITGLPSLAETQKQMRKISFQETMDGFNNMFNFANEAAQPLLNTLRSLGPEGEAQAAVIQGVFSLQSTIGSSFKKISEEGLTIGAAFEAAAAVISGVQAIVSAASQARIAGIDKEIAAEQKRDGKSAESVAKIQALEKKKDDAARKSFNTNKKLMMAQAIVSTAAGVANALATPAPYPIPAIMAGIIGAMGAAQLAIIASTQYGGGSKSSAVSTPSTLSIGKRSDTIDLARGPSANAGGEVGFLRGSQGTGTNASNFRTIGSAYGGELMRGYGNRGFVVGEKGPEVITPETPINVTPANDVMGQAPVNATFNIQAMDSSDVQRVLVEQKGNIIKMLRDAANASGKGFLEDVNVNVYTRPNVNRL